MSPLRISVILGTRPEAIKLAPVILALRANRVFDCHVCVTAQHREMLDQVLRVFSITPDADLDLMMKGQTLGDFTARALKATEEYLRCHRPDLLLLQGDTTTVLAGALAAFYQNVPFGHVEAGLRTGDIQAPWPEEANRVLASRLATLHFAPTATSRLNLIREGVKENRIFVTGNTVIDALLLAVRMLNMRRVPVPGLASALLEEHPGRPLVLITGHRRESFGGDLENICLAIGDLAGRFPEAHFVYPVHLNPDVRATVYQVLGNGRRRENVHLLEPLDYLPFISLMQRATVILTDSGGVQEEAPSLGKPVLVTRRCTERPEGLATGTVKLVGADRERIVAEIGRLLADESYRAAMTAAQNPYGDGRATERILAAIRAFFDRRTVLPTTTFRSGPTANVSIS